ncbi:MAG: polyprenol monophosphomannose synthase [Anaerolineales bacterium]
MKIVVVLPTYNEADNLRAMVEALWVVPLPLTVLVVDDASPDGTGQIADELARAYPERLAVIHRPGLLGLGTAYVQGFRRALEMGAETVIQMDADFSHSPDYLAEMARRLESYDVVIGSRYVPGGSTDRRWGLGRKLLSGWAKWAARTILGLTTHDATAGFRVWRRTTLIGMDLSRFVSNGYVFQVELSYVTERLGYRVLEAPIYFEDRRIGHSKMSMPVKIEAALRVWEVGWRHRGLTPKDRKT